MRRSSRLGRSQDPLSTATTEVRNAFDFYVAIDFGTTFTAIAFSKGDAAGHDISTVDEFSGDNFPALRDTEVPTEILFTIPKTGERPTKRRRLDREPNVLFAREIAQYFKFPLTHPKRADHKDAIRIEKSKLLLYESSNAFDFPVHHKKLVTKVESLQKNGLYLQNEDIIVKLLTYFLNCTKIFLEQHHGFKENSTVEVTIAVPICWTEKANNTMNACLQAAMKEVRFGTNGTDRAHTFMINEAEAAATYVVAHATTSLPAINSYKCGETFVLLDCGGGTTDAATYRISQDNPIQLGKTVVPPRGAFCGSGDVNEGMRVFTAPRLKGQKELLDSNDSGSTIENIIETEIIPKFENIYKRAYNPSKKSYYEFWLRGLKPVDGSPNVMLNTFVLQHNDMKAVFDKPLRTIADLMTQQLDLANAKDIAIDKVVLVGGFGDSHALKEYLRNSLATWNTLHMENVTLVTCPHGQSAFGVAKGALIRARSGIRSQRRDETELHYISSDSSLS
ncbi:hypothetical protein GQ44DRAFT_417296 [Phaeosphaeriaceae sp. PMI808]|nr:hypothetical protein GQ44DRAFT_417296 [Phaeosphaeriaceae sp. PMI808]